VWRSASKSGDTKTPKSKRSLELPKRAIAALIVHRARQADERRAAGGAWHDNDLVFCHKNGEGRHTAVSIMSSNGVPIQDISGTLGHKSTHVTETVYRHVIVPEIRGGATVMDDVFNDD
jgi:integrase